MSLDEIIRLSAEADLQDEIVDSYCSETHISRKAFYGAFAHRVAHGFMGGEFSYEQSDAAMSCLIGFADYEFSDYAWSVFSAFDEGEYYHGKDSPDIDPVEKYTRPAILHIIAAENLD